MSLNNRLNDSTATSYLPEETWDAANDTTEIDLVALFYRLIEKVKWIISAAVIMALLFGIGCRYFVAPEYTATSRLYVVNSRNSLVDISDLQFGSYLAKDYERMFDAWEIHDMVRTNLSLDYTYATMKEQLKVSNPDSTRILAISFTSTDPKEAQAVANEYAAVSMHFISDIMLIDEPTLLSSALLPTNPVNTSPARAAVLGFLLGAILAAAIITVAFILDDRIKTAEDIQRCSGIPVLAVVPKNTQKTPQ